jgi:hypothetical protein
VDVTLARRAQMISAVGRIVLGAAVFAAPEKVTQHWLGEENAHHPAVGDLARGLAMRDIALGVAVLQTINDPIGGPRIQAGVAAADAADAIGTILARRSLPTVGVLGTVLIAGGAAATGFYLSHVIAHS